MTEGSQSDGEDKSVREALTFARQMAKEEIDSIERIHKRTLPSFGYIGVFVAAAIAIFGYIGYSNLRDASIATAREQMQEEVKEQVQKKLTTENINQIVRDQVKDLSTTTLTAEIHKELNSPPLSDSIRLSADDETQRQIAKQFSPRHFSPEQSKHFIERLAEMTDLDGITVSVSSLVFDVEATNYASEIKGSASHGKWKVVDNIGFNALPVEGIGIYYDKKQSESYARHLQDALGAAGVSSKLVPSEYPTFVIKDGSPALEIFVGVKPMQ